MARNGSGRARTAAGSPEPNKPNVHASANANPTSPAAAAAARAAFPKRCAGCGAPRGESIVRRRGAVVLGLILARRRQLQRAAFFWRMEPRVPAESDAAKNFRRFPRVRKIFFWGDNARVGAQSALPPLVWLCTGACRVRAHARAPARRPTYAGVGIEMLLRVTPRAAVIARAPTWSGI